MLDIIVSCTDSQGKTHIFDKPASFNPANDPFLFGLERGRKAAAKECVELISSVHVDEYGNGQIADAVQAIQEKFGLEI